MQRRSIFRNLNPLSRERTLTSWQAQYQTLHGLPSKEGRALEFQLARNLARKFANSDITNQELLDKGQVLVNGVRIALNLQAAE